MSIDIINNNGYVIIDIISIIFMAMKRLILKIYSIVKIIKKILKSGFQLQTNMRNASITHTTIAMMMATIVI